MEELNTVLRLRPSYLDAIRLKERIIAEEEGQEALDELERRMMDTVDSREAPNWRRR